jgi:hypothetical protein
VYLLRRFHFPFPLICQKCIVQGLQLQWIVGDGMYSTNRKIYIRKFAAHCTGVIGFNSAKGHHAGLRYIAHLPTDILK